MRSWEYNPHWKKDIFVLLFLLCAFLSWLCFRLWIPALTTPSRNAEEDACKEVPPQWRGVDLLVLKTGPEQEYACIFAAGQRLVPADLTANGLNCERCRVAAAAGVIPMSQNIRGTVFPMGGMRGVSSFPEGRRCVTFGPDCIERFWSLMHR